MPVNISLLIPTEVVSKSKFYGLHLELISFIAFVHLFTGKTRQRTLLLLYLYTPRLIIIYAITKNVSAR